MYKRLAYIYNKINQEDGKGFVYYSAFIPLYLLSILYGIGVRLRFLLYCIGVFKTHRLDCKVISVGNITIGGSGKTPMAIYLAKRLLERGKKAVILSRGYKGKIKDAGVVSDGKDILLGPEDAGDEPHLMAVKLKTVPVIVGRDRYTAGMYAVERFKPDIIILDDGFQHIRLARDMDIALIDLRRGFGNGHLFPMGILREPLSGLRRASLIMLKGSNPPVSPFEKGGFNEGRMGGFNCQTISFSYKAKEVSSLFDGSILNLKGKKVIALSGIADPKSFSETLKELGAIVIEEIVYPDHHFYTSDDLKKIKDTASEAEIIVTTEKDGVKLKRLSIKDLPIYTIAIDVDIENTKNFNEILMNV